MRRPDPSPAGRRSDPDARLRELAGLPPAEAARARAFNDANYRDWKDQVAQYVKAYRPRPMFEDAVLLAVTFHVRPHDKIGDDLLGLPHRSTPDLDRYLHACADALVQGGVMTDDRLIAATFCVKVWSVDRKRPRIDVLVVPFESAIVASMRALTLEGVGVVDVAEAAS